MHNQFLSILFGWIMAVAPISIMAQISFKKKDTISIEQKYTPEIFTSGFIDILNTGQVNASARVLRIMIGEPGKFHLPLSFYGGVSNNNFQASNTTTPSLKSNEHLAAHFVNPLAGLINISTENVLYFNKQNTLTRKGILYHVGVRVLTGVKSGYSDPVQNGKPFNFLNSFLSGGLYFQTGAWERNDSKNVGLFWVTVRSIICKSSTRSLKAVMPKLETNGFYSGISLAFGIEINNLVNMKIIYYKYLKAPEQDYNQSIYQFAFNYSLKK